MIRTTTESPSLAQDLPSRPSTTTAATETTYPSARTVCYVRLVDQHPWKDGQERWTAAAPWPSPSGCCYHPHHHHLPRNGPSVIDPARRTVGIAGPARCSVGIDGSCFVSESVHPRTTCGRAMVDQRDPCEREYTGWTWDLPVPSEGPAETPAPAPEALPAAWEQLQLPNKDRCDRPVSSSSFSCLVFGCWCSSSSECVSCFENGRLLVWVGHWVYALQSVKRIAVLGHFGFACFAKEGSHGEQRAD